MVRQAISRGSKYVKTGSGIIYKLNFWDQTSSSTPRLMYTCVSKDTNEIGKMHKSQKENGCTIFTSKLY